MTLLLLAGCTHTSTPPTGDVPTKRITASEILERAMARPVARTLQGTTKMKLTTPSRSARLRGVVVISAPEQLRAEVLSIVGQPVAYLVSAPGDLTLFSPYSGLAISSRDPFQVVHQLTGGTVGLTDLLGLFLGQLPACQVNDRAALEIRTDRFVVACENDGDDGNSRSLHFDLNHLDLIEVEGESSTRGPFTVTLGSHKEIEGVSLPHHIALSAPNAGLEVELDYEEVVINQAIDPGLFTLALPQGLVFKDFEEMWSTTPTPGEKPPPSPPSSEITPTTPVVAPAPPVESPSPESGIAP